MIAQPRELAGAPQQRVDRALLRRQALARVLERRGRRGRAPWLTRLDGSLLAADISGVTGRRSRRAPAYADGWLCLAPARCSSAWRRGCY